MESPLSHFQFAQFRFFLKSQGVIHLPPYKGSVLRGGFGHAFKKVVCVNRERICTPCLLKEKCVYSYVFETPPPSDTSKMRKYPYAPHPFIITPPAEEKREYHDGEVLCFELTLIGKSIDFLPYFIYTFDELGRMGIGKAKGRYHLQEVKAKVSKEKAVEDGVIYSGEDKTLRSNFRVMGIEDLGGLASWHPASGPSLLSISFLTPTRLKFDGSLSSRPQFHIFFRNLLRRVSLLSYFHCGKELALDFKGLIEKSEAIRVKRENLCWFDWERYSSRQGKRMKMGGFIGTITFEGNFEPFVPFLLLGEQIHVGKGTSFGLGKYKILNFES